MNFLLFENYWHFSSTLSTKSNGTYSKIKQKNKCDCIHGIIRLILMKMKTEMKNWWRRYDISRPKPRYSKYKKCLNMMLLVCIKQHLSNLKQNSWKREVTLRVGWKNALLIKKSVYFLKFGLWWMKNHHTR